MKKRILTITLAVLMALTMLPTAAFADVFVASPSTVTKPTVDSITDKDGNAAGSVKFVPFDERDTLGDEEKKAMEDAYDSIKKASSVTELNDGIASIAKEKGVKSEDLAVSDLFGFYSAEENADDPTTVTAKLTSDSFEDFVALMYYDGSSWVLVDNVKVTGKTISFTVPTGAPIATVVGASTETPDSPQTGEAFPWALLACAAVLGVTGVCLLCKGRKEEIGA